MRWRQGSWLAMVIWIGGSSGGCGETTRDPTNGSASKPDEPLSDGECTSQAPNDRGQCAAGFWQYVDEACDPWSGEDDVNGPPQCFELGDEQCYALCDDDSDCPACAPNCCQVTLCNGGDGCGVGPPTVCASDAHDCPLFPF